jgi:acetylornithine deacetylase
MKGGIAVILAVMARAAQSPYVGNIVAVLVPDEEHESFGIRGILPSIKADAAVLAEGTGLDLGMEHCGRVRCIIPTDGISHRCAIAWLLFLNARKNGRCRPTASFALGGNDELILEKQVGPYEGATAVKTQIAADLSALDDRVRARIRWEIRESFSAADTHALTRILREKIAIQRGIAGVSKRLEGWTEAGVLVAHGIPSIIFGPEGGEAHTTHEWVDVTTITKAADILSVTAEEFCC